MLVRARLAGLSWTGPVALAGALAASLFGAALLFGGGARLQRADFVFNNSSEVASLDPAHATGIPEGRILRAVFEGLCLKDPRDLSPLPGMAQSWDVSPDGLAYTFHLREARWTNGDPVTANDFAFSLRRVLSPETGCQYADQLYCIDGAREFHTGLDAAGAPLERVWRRVGVLPQDERTLSIRLVRPTPWFLHLMSFHAFYPVNPRSLREARQRWPDTWEVEWLAPENMVSNGPFRVAERRINDRIRLAKNETYWDAERVAFRTIDALAIEHWSTALNMYLTGDIDWLDGTIPSSLVMQLKWREDFLPRPFLGSYFYRVNTTRPPFDDPRVRRALSLLIPREAICKRVLKAGQLPLTSLVPGPMPDGYVPPKPRTARASEELTDALEFDDYLALRDGGQEVAQARRLLEDAGFGPRGRPMPPIVLHYNTGELHGDIAEVIGRAWEKQLGLQVRYRNQEWKVFLESQRALDYDISRSSWIGDYPDPHTFLQVFTSTSANNRTGWSHAQYDSLLAEAENEARPARRLALLYQAEEILIEEGPILPIYAYVTQNLVNPRLGGFADNLLNEQYPKFWYWKDEAELGRTRMSNREGIRPAPAPGPRRGLYSPAAQRQRAARESAAPRPRAPERAPEPEDGL